MANLSLNKFSFWRVGGRRGNYYMCVDIVLYMEVSLKLPSQLG